MPVNLPEPGKTQTGCCNVNVIQHLSSAKGVRTLTYRNKLGSCLSTATAPLFGYQGRVAGNRPPGRGNRRRRLGPSIHSNSAMDGQFGRLPLAKLGCATGLARCLGQGPEKHKRREKRENSIETTSRKSWDLRNTRYERRREATVSDCQMPLFN